MVVLKRIACTVEIIGIEIHFSSLPGVKFLRNLGAVTYLLFFTIPYILLEITLVYFFLKFDKASLVAHMAKNLPAVQETQVRSLGQKDALGKRMATHFSILVWRIPWTEEPDGLQSMGLQGVKHDWATFTFTYFFNLTNFERIILRMQNLGVSWRYGSTSLFFPSARGV